MPGKKQSVNKLHAKILATALSLVITVVLSVSVTYAWMSLSTSPEASGAQVAIAGGTTILLAPDISGSYTLDEQVYTVHYPGAFAETLNFAAYPASYGYLSSLSGLAPVSTADGVHWIIPTYNSTTGELNAVSAFRVDDELEFANLTDPNPNGSYIYLDFWVVSPGSDYLLRVSTDVRSHEGSAMMDLPSVTTDGTAFALDYSGGSATAFARVGFLVNGDGAGEASLLAYRASAGFDERFTNLLGSYLPAGETHTFGESDSFTIYEPNGTGHIDGGVPDGDYAITSPLAVINDNIVAADIRDRLTVQLESIWSEAQIGTGTEIDQRFQTAIAGRDNVTVSNAMRIMLEEHLQWQISPYITTGDFIRSTMTLYSNADNGVVAASRIGNGESNNVRTAGATDDVYITKLQRNVPQRIRMFIWLEGQDADCEATNIDVTKFILNLELAGES